jgi:hypothetical protein
MQEPGEELIEDPVEQERSCVNHPPAPLLPELPTIHYTELAEAPPDSPIATEWNFYRREVGRLLTEGHEGKWVLIKGEQMVGLYETHEEAYRMQCALIVPVVIKQILKHEPVLRIGYNPICRS